MKKKKWFCIEKNIFNFLQVIFFPHKMNWSIIYILIYLNLDLTPLAKGLALCGPLVKSGLPLFYMLPTKNVFFNIFK